MGFFSDLFGGQRANEAAQHEISIDILLEQHRAITDILNSILTDKQPDPDIKNEIDFFSTLVATSTYMVGAVTGGMNQEDTHYIIEWFMKNVFKDKRLFSLAVDRHKTYYPFLQKASHNNTAFYQLADLFIEHTGESDNNTALAIRVSTWLTTSVEPAMINIASIIKKAGKS